MSNIVEIKLLKFSNFNGILSENVIKFYILGVEYEKKL